MSNRSPSFAAALVLTGAALIFASGPASAATPTELTSGSIRNAIEDELAFDPAVPSRAIEVRVTDGVATLTGTANDLLAKERAARIAGMVKGVRSVVNQIEVRPSLERSDAQVKNDVVAALGADPAADAYELGVSVTDGVVSLSGTVDSYQERRLATKVAMGVRGVRGVDDSGVTLERTQDRPDSEILPEVEQALRWDVLIDDGLIDVSVRDGTVTLSGTVGSVAEKTEAFFDAWVAGVRSVDVSGLEVSRWARDDDLRRDKYALRTDAEIEKTVEAALLQDPRVAAFNVDVEVADAVVTLRGTVDNLEARRAAVADADQTVGVVRVRDRLRVQPSVAVADADLENRVADALQRDAVVESFEVRIDADAGIVTLEGTVDSSYERARADLVAGLVPGVIAVENRLDVHDADVYVFDPFLDDYDFALYDWGDRWEPRYTMRSDAEIEQEVEDQLWWSPFVDANEVEVSVADGVVTLTGTVDSWSERHFAASNAFEAGASWVRNRLEVSPAS